MSTLREYYNTGDDAWGGIYSTIWTSQSFPAAETYNISSIKLKLYRSATYNPGTVTVSIRAASVSTHKPTGADLVSGTTDGSTLTTTSPGEWREIILDAPYTLTGGGVYAIVLRCELWDNNVMHVPCYWRRDSSSGYADGKSCGSTDSGVTWGTVSSTLDYMFENWGDPPALPNKPINPTPLHEASDVTLDQTAVTWEDGGGATSYDVYKGTLSGFLELVESGVTDTSYILRSTNWPQYGEAYYWRIDAVNSSGTTTGDEWYFTTLIFKPPTPNNIIWTDPGNDDGYTGTPTGVNNMITVRRLCGCAKNTFWYESL